jgi:hypothetical protein
MLLIRKQSIRFPMNFLSSFTKRIEIIVFILGFAVGIYMLFFPARYFFAWHALPTSPEPIARIVATNHMGDVTIETMSNKKLLCNIDHEKECWVKLDNNYQPFNLGKTLCLEDCPDKHTLQMMSASYEILFFARPAILYALHDDGIIYVRHTGIIFWPGYIMGVILGGFCAFIVFLIRRR